jgi:uncharacterized repeat protein (TIGR03943 family)
MEKKAAIPRYVWLFAAGGWGVFLIAMHQGGDLLRYYQAEPYNHFTGAAGVVLLALSLKGVLWPSRGHVDCGCAHDVLPHEEAHTQVAHEHEHGGTVGQAFAEASAGKPADRGTGGAVGRFGRAVKAGLLVAIFVAPVVIGVVVPTRYLNSLAAQRRGGSVDPQAILATFRSARQRVAELEKGGFQKLNTLEIIEAAYAQKEGAPPLKVSTVALASRRGELPTDLFRAIRFRMVCCAADASPIEVLVRWPQATNIENDAWVKILGTARREMIDGRPAVVVTASDVVPVAAPGYPYI